MAKYKEGDSVKTIGSNELAVVIKVYPKIPGRQLYQVVLDNGDKKDMLEKNLLPNANYSDPFDCCTNGIYGSNSDFFCLNTSFKIRNTNNNTISTLKASKTIFKAYQFKPLLKFLNSRNHRILIADEVGLGKTIEAGHIMLELAARRELKNAMIICPKSLQRKWQDELLDKFGFSFKIYDNAKDFIQDMNYLDDNIRAIINYEKLRDNGPLLKALESSSRRMDFVLCDEAHRLRNSETLIHRGLRKVLESPASVVFLTATPVMISQENLFNLLSLLDEEQYGNYSVFLNTLSINAPFVKAISQLNNGVDYSTIAQELDESLISTSYVFNNGNEEYVVDNRETCTVGEKFKDSPLYQRIIQDLKSGDRSNETQVRLQFDLSSMSPMNSIFSRTRKVEVTTDTTQAIRDTHTKIVSLYPDEQDYFDEVYDQYDDEYYDGDWFKLLSQKRMISSSVYAYMNSQESLDNGIDEYEEFPDAKFENLLQIINAVKADGESHLIVFAVYRKTLKYLSIRLRKEGYDNIIISGESDYQERYQAIEDFKNSKSFNILLSSEVGGEGLDMQFCNSMVNYDLPWNPMIVEQRIGRIDRFGQTSPKVHIYNLVIENSIQVDIYTRLLDRIDIFKNCIGDLEAILDKDLQQNGVRNIQEWFTRLETELYCNKVSEEERRQKVDAIAKAILTERKNLEEVNKGLTNTLTNDLYFQNEIESINRNNRYVTEDEVENYVRLLIEKKIPTACLIRNPNLEKTFMLKIPKSQPKLLLNFLTEYAPVQLGRDFERLNNEFKSKVVDELEIPITFSQDVAYNHKELNFINAYHPLMTAAYLFYKENVKQMGKAFSFSLPKEQFQGYSDNLSSEYFMALYIISVEKEVYNSTQTIEIMTPVLYDAEQDKVVEDQNLIDAIYSASQSAASVIHTVSDKVDESMVLSMRISMEEEVNKSRKKFVDDQIIRIDTQKDIQIKQYVAYYDTRIRAYQRILRRHEDEAQSIYVSEETRRNATKVIPLDKSRLQHEIEAKEAVVAKLRASRLQEKEHQLISISHITLS